MRSRALVGTHLEYEKRIQNERLRFHLEKNLSTINPDREYVMKLTENVWNDFSDLATLLQTDPSLKRVRVLEGITNFQEKTGRRYGFTSKVIITNALLCMLFDNRIDKPPLAHDLFSAPPIRLFEINREEFLRIHLKKE